MPELGPYGSGAARLAAIPAGESPANRGSPVTVVVISRNGEGDRSVESREVKAPGGWAFQSDPYRGASNLTGCSECVNQEAPKTGPARNGLREGRGCRAAQISAKAMSTSRNWTSSMPSSPGSERTACQEGMCSESSEPLAGRLGAPAQRRHRV